MTARVNPDADTRVKKEEHDEGEQQLAIHPGDLSTITIKPDEVEGDGAVKAEQREEDGAAVRNEQSAVADVEVEEPPPPRIQAYAKLEFPFFNFYIQKLSVTIGRRPPESRQPSDPPAQSQPHHPPTTTQENDNNEVKDDAVKVGNIEGAKEEERPGATEHRGSANGSRADSGKIEAESQDIADQQPIMQGILSKVEPKETSVKPEQAEASVQREHSAPPNESGTVPTTKAEKPIEVPSTAGNPILDGDAPMKGEPSTLHVDTSGTPKVENRNGAGEERAPEASTSALPETGEYAIGAAGDVTEAPVASTSTLPAKYSANKVQVDVDLGPIKAVSRDHARLFFDSEINPVTGISKGWSLEVRGRNGLVLDGQWRAKGEVGQLTHRSRIQIAERIFHFVLPNGVYVPPVYPLFDQYGAHFYGNDYPGINGHAQEWDYAPSQGGMSPPLVYGSDSDELRSDDEEHTFRRRDSNGMLRGGSSDSANGGYSGSAYGHDFTGNIVDPVTGAILKRKRGRPPKVRTAEELAALEEEKARRADPNAPKRPRGRPPKNDQSADGEEGEENAQPDEQGQGQGTSTATQSPSTAKASTSTVTAPGGTSSTAGVELDANGQPVKKLSKKQQAELRKAERERMKAEKAEAKEREKREREAAKAAKKAEKERLDREKKERDREAKEQREREAKEAKEKAEREKKERERAAKEQEEDKKKKEEEERKKNAAAQLQRQKELQQAQQAATAAAAAQTQAAKLALPKPAPPPQQPPTQIDQIQNWVPTNQFIGRPDQPPYSYAALIAQAIYATPHKQAQISHIQSWIPERYPYFKQHQQILQAAIRKDLAVNRAFVNIPLQSGVALWALETSHAKYFDGNTFLPPPPSTDPITIAPSISATPVTASPVPAHRLATPGLPASPGPSASPQPAPVPPAPSAASSSPKIPIIISSLPPSYQKPAPPSASDPGAMLDPNGFPPIAIHQEKMYLSPSIFSSLTAQQLSNLQTLDTKQALNILQAFVVNYFKTELKRRKKAEKAAAAAAAAAQAAQIVAAAQSQAQAATALATPSAAVNGAGIKRPAEDGSADNANKVQKVS